MKVSVIIPCRNEEHNIAKVYAALVNDLKDIKYEIIYIDDGSTDNTYLEMANVYQKDKKHVKVISFSRTFNKDAALLAGINYADGDYFCLFSSKYYANTKDILAMADYLEDNQNIDQVVAVINRQVNCFEDLMIKLINKLSPQKISSQPVAFRLITQRLGEALLKVTERERFTEGLFSWLGYSSKTIIFEDKGNNEIPKISLIKRWRYTINSIVKHTTKPLLIAKYIGFWLISLDLIYLIYSLFNNIVAFQAITILILFLIGMQFICLGIISEYLAQIYWETKNRPNYLIRDKLGFDDNIL